MSKYRIWCDTEAAYVYVWSNVEPTTCPNDGGHTIDPTKTAIVEVSRVTLDQRMTKLENVNRVTTRLSMRSSDGFVDDFVDDSGVDGGLSVNHSVGPEGFVTVSAAGEVVSVLVATKRPKTVANVFVEVYAGAPTIFLSDDDGSTWADITGSIGADVAVNGKEFRLKAVMLPEDQIAAWGLDLS